jgi:hypothetical protein
VLNIDGKLTVYYSSGRADGKEQKMELTHFLIAMGSRFIPIGKSEAVSHTTPEPVVAPSAPVITITTVSGETIGTTATEDEALAEEAKDSTEIK